MVASMVASTQTTEMTIAETIAEYTAYKREKIGLPNDHGLRQNSFNSLCAHLKAITATIDADQSIGLSKRAIEKICDSWLRKVTSKQVSYITATAYLTTFKTFLNWCDYDDAIPYQHPHGIERLFQFNTIKPKIAEYDGKQLCSVMSSLDSKTQTHMLMGLHFGYYPVDISRLWPEMIRRVGEDHYVVRVRERISHVSENETWHWIPPELFKRMEQHKAKQHGSYFQNAQGNDLQTVGKTITCNISTNYSRGLRKAGVHLPFKQLRKLGATWIANHVDVEASRMYRASMLGSLDRLYIKDDCIKKLTPALKAWHQKLANDGLYGVGPRVDGRTTR